MGNFANDCATEHVKTGTDYHAYRIQYHTASIETWTKKQKKKKWKNEMRRNEITEKEKIKRKKKWLAV